MSTANMHDSTARPVARLLADARSAQRKGAEDRAEAIYHDILRRFPGNRTARLALADLAVTGPAADLPAILRLYNRRRYKEVLDATAAFLDSDPGNADALNLKAASHRMLGQPDPALTIYRGLLDSCPEDAALWQKCGATLMDMIRLQEAAECLEMATRLAPDQALNWISLATCHQRRGDHMQAYDALTQALGRAPDHSAALDQLGQVLRDLGRVDLAIAAHQRALDTAKTKTETSAACTSLGVARSAQGDKDAARTFYRRAIDAQPRNVQALLNLARMVEDPADPVLTQQLTDFLQDPAQSPLNRSHAHFALFSLLDRLDDDRETAFGQLKAGNDLRRSVIRYAPESQEVLFDFIRKLSERTEPASGPSKGVRPVFIVGLPRSGTTLTEQMVSGSPGVFGGGELTIAETLSLELIRTLQAQKCRSLTAENMQDFGTTLRARLTAAAGDAPVILDKMPLNFRWVGLILAALPDARIVHVTRDPMETCWSNYKTTFASHGNGFVYGLGDLVHYHRLYRGLMAHWQDRYPTRIHTVRYEDLVADTAPVLRRILDFSGLDWSDDCLHPERSDRAVLTASAHQVRRPVYDGNRGDWRRYAPSLAPLINGLPDPTGAVLS